MLYTELTKKAMKIAFEAHKNQRDKSCMPYIYHPIHLAEQMTDEKTTCVALLHDVAEDTDITIEQLAAEGFPDDVIHALRLMTHDQAVPYLDYVENIRANPIAAAVKLADLRHNSDLTRLDMVDEKALKRVEKYKKAIRLLSDDRYKYYRYCGGKLVKHDTAKDLFYSLDESGEWKTDGHAMSQYFDSAAEYEEITPPDGER